MESSLRYGRRKRLNECDCFVLQRARDELARRVIELEERNQGLEEHRAYSQRKNGGESQEVIESGRGGGDGAGDAQYENGQQHEEEEEEEVEALRKDVDTLLMEVERERIINEELEQMIRYGEKENKKLASKLEAAEKRIEKQKAKMRKSIGTEDSQNAEEIIEGMQERLRLLTESRNMLIESLDASADELDRISKENEALAVTVEGLRDTNQAWENQVQSSLSLTSHLQELLEEKSEWATPRDDESLPSSIPLLNHHRIKTIDDTYSEEMVMLKKEYDQMLLHYKSLEANMLQWQNKCAKLEVQVVSLCTELNRMTEMTQGLSTSIIPLLCNIESKVEGVVNSQS